MPKSVTIRASQTFKPLGTLSASEQERLKKLHKSLKPIVVSYQTALDNVRNSNGMYEIAPVAATKAPSQTPTLEDMDLDDLKVLMLQAGVKTDKQLTREQVITVIRKKLDAIDLVEE